jgi:RimJ/RimL family protein N-acetyltransferase
LDRLVFGKDNEVLRWASQEMFGPSFGRMSGGFMRPCVAIGVERAGKLIGAAIFNGYDGRSIELTAVGRSAFSRRLAAVCCAYAFNQLGCRRMSATVRADNVSVLDYCRRLGFSEEGVIRKKFNGDVDGIALGMLREECRWLPKASDKEAA